MVEEGGGDNEAGEVIDIILYIIIILYMISMGEVGTGQGKRCSCWSNSRGSTESVSFILSSLSPPGSRD